MSADWGLNVLQPWTVEALAEAGADMVWASPELSGRQLSRLCGGAAIPVGALVHGRVEVMVAEHCVLQATGECSHDCPRCARRRRQWDLVDRKGYRFPVATDAAGRTHVYNSVPLDLSRSLREVVSAGVAAVRLDLHLESPAEAARLVRAYRSLMAGAVAGRQGPAEALSTPATSGHFFRGVG